ncbi:unnamed protein product [Tenebrio molitor]|nr:unnamed protein product [Tenebrio molitor]
MERHKLIREGIMCKIHNPAPKGGSSSPAFQRDKEELGKFTLDFIFLPRVVRPDDNVTSSGNEPLSERTTFCVLILLRLCCFSFL